MTPRKYQPVPPTYRPGEQWLRVEEVAAEWRVSKMTVYRLIKSGQLPASRIGHSMRVRERDMDAYARGTETILWEEE